MTVELHLDDCLEVMRSMPDKSVDAVTPIENSFYSYAELTEEQKIRFAAYQVFDTPKKASSNIKDTELREELADLRVRVGEAGFDGRP